MEENENFLQNNQMVVAVLGWSSWHWRKLVDCMTAFFSLAAMPCSAVTAFCHKDGVAQNGRI